MHPRRHRPLRALAFALALALLGALLSGGSAVASALPLVAGPSVMHGTAPALGRWPLRPRPAVVRRFDPPSSPWGSGHRGVDLAGTPGSTVRSALPGRVTFAGPLAGRGVVVVDHGDTRTTYEPVRAGVRLGQVVAGGGRLGTLEPTGSHCAPATCLHWGWIRGEDYLDPLGLVGAGRVRLLPLSGRILGAATSARLPVVGRLAARPTVAAGQARGWACW